MARARRNRKPKRRIKRKPVRKMAHGGRTKPVRKIAHGGRTKPVRKMAHGGIGTNTSHTFYDVMNPNSEYCTGNGVLVNGDCGNQWYNPNNQFGCCHGDCSTYQGCQKACERVCFQETGERHPENRGICSNYDNDGPPGMCHTTNNVCTNNSWNAGEPCTTHEECLPNEEDITPATCRCYCYNEENNAIPRPGPRPVPSVRQASPGRRKPVRRRNPSPKRKGGRAKPRRKMAHGGMHNHNNGRNQPMAHRKDKESYIGNPAWSKSGGKMPHGGSTYRHNSSCKMHVSKYDCETANGCHWDFNDNCCH